MLDLNGILINNLEDILFGFIVIDIINMQNDFCNIVTVEIKAPFTKRNASQLPR